MPASAPPKSATVRFSTKLFYGIGSVSEGTKNTVFNVFLLFYYNQVLGLSGTLSGSAIFIALCVDAITDPLVGSISDNFHSRWGRRHPFMYMAALPMAVCFFLLFNPPELSQTGLFVWLCTFAMGVRIAMTFYAVPSGAMLPELSSDYDERTSLVSYRLLFGWLGGLTASVLGYFYFFAPSEAFADGRLNPGAYETFAFVCAGMILTTILACALGTHGLIPSLRAPSAKQQLTLRRFAGELREAFSNRSYRMLVIGSLFAAGARGFNDVVWLYMNTYFWGFSTHEIGLLTFGLFFSALIAFFLTRPLTERFDKRQAILGLAAFAIFFGPALIFLRLFGLLPENGHPSLLPLIAGHVILLVTAVVAIDILIPSMIADSVDENEMVTGRRREGIFFSTITFCAKAASGIGGLLAGVALDLIQFPTLAEPGTVAASQVFTLGLAVGPGLMVLFLCALVFLSRYQMTRARYLEILTELDRRQKDTAQCEPGVASEGG